MAEFEVKCNECNAALDAAFANDILYVDICQDCRTVEYDKGHQHGYDLSTEEREK